MSLTILNKGIVVVIRTVTGQEVRNRGTGVDHLCRMIQSAGGKNAQDGGISGQLEAKISFVGTDSDAAAKFCPSLRACCRCEHVAVARSARCEPVAVARTARCEINLL